MKGYRYRALVMAAVLLVVVTAGRPAFAVVPTWPDGHTPTINCATGVAESYVDETLYAWTSTTCNPPPGAAFAILRYQGTGYTIWGLVQYGPSHQINHFAIPTGDLGVSGRTAICLGRNPTLIMVGPTPNLCVELFVVNGQVQSSPLSVDESFIIDARLMSGPTHPTCLTCLVEGDD